MDTNRRVSFFWSILITCLLLSSGLRAADPSPAPKKLSAAIGGFLGGAFIVEMTAPDTVTYTHSARPSKDGPKAERTTVKVTDAQWKAFRAHLDEAKVWSWKDDYVNNGIVDGTMWRFTVDFGDKKIETNGRNAYPEQAQFDAMLAAVRELLGGKDFW